MNLIKNLTVITLATAIVYGCGGGGGGSAPATPDGIYTGNITGGDPSINGNEKAIVYNNRMLVISPAGDIQQVFDSTMVIDNKSFTTSKSVRYAGFSLSNSASLSTSGTFEPSSSLTATFSDIDTVNPFPSGTINLTFDAPVYNKTSGLDIIAGTWTGPFALFTVATLMVNADGTFNGSEDSQGCLFNGTITVPDPTFNVYEVSLDSTASCTSLPIGNYTGLAWIEGDTNNTLYFSVSNDTNNRSFILTK